MQSGCNRASTAVPRRTGSLVQQRQATVKGADSRFRPRANWRVAPALPAVIASCLLDIRSLFRYGSLPATLSMAVVSRSRSLPIH